jgi:hypothetical protein
MKYTVLWVRRAEAKLAQIWNQAADRAEVAQAANSIDTELCTDPDNCGESRPDDLRIFIVSPLAVTFRIELTTVLCESSMFGVFDESDHDILPRRFGFMSCSVQCVC